MPKSYLEKVRDIIVEIYTISGSVDELVLANQLLGVLSPFLQTPEYGEVHAAIASRILRLAHASHKSLYYGAYFPSNFSRPPAVLVQASFSGLLGREDQVRGVVGWGTNSPALKLRVRTDQISFDLACAARRSQVTYAAWRNRLYAIQWRESAVDWVAEVLGFVKDSEPVLYMVPIPGHFLEGVIMIDNPADLAQQGRSLMHYLPKDGQEATPYFVCAGLAGIPLVDQMPEWFPAWKPET